MKKDFDSKDYQACLSYLKSSWGKITFENKTDHKTLIGLPNKYISPNGTWFGGDMFYWDSYFIILGLIESGKVNLAKGIVDNFVYLYKRFGIIPSRNRFYDLGISQPPFLTSMALEVFEKTDDKKWLQEVAKIAEQELGEYWIDKHHQTELGLSRYADHYIIDQTAEQESGWDMTSRFNKKCLDYIPVDLNSFLFKYESDLARIYTILGDKKAATKWQKRASERKTLIYKYCWSKARGFFFDYSVTTKKRALNYSLAGFVPLWAGLVEKSDAKRIRRNLQKFEYQGGLSTTKKPVSLKKLFQWDYPNGWAPLHYIVIKGLLNYGYYKDAVRIGKKWLDLNASLYKSTGYFWERYDVVKASIPEKERYPLQTGFGWTNGVFIKLVNELDAINAQ